MQTVLTIAVVIAVWGVVGWFVGVILDWLAKRHIGQNITDIERTCESCYNCKHGEREWDEDPCLSCTEYESKWEEKDADSAI